MEDLIMKAMNQNFIPVLDDKKSFIGIITRKDIIKYFYQKYRSFQEEEAREEKRRDEKASKLSGISAVIRGEESLAL